MKKINSKTETALKTYTAVIEVPATETHYGRRHNIGLDADETAKVQEYADRCGMTIDALVRAYITGRGRYDMRPFDYSRPPKVKVEGVVFAVRADKSHLKRFRRAVEFAGQTEEQFITAAINGNIVAYEDDMLVNPKTGELLGSDDLGGLLWGRGTEEMEPSLKHQREGTLPRGARASVLLDGHMTALAQQFLKDGADHASAECMEDLVNAAVEFFLDENPEALSTADFVERARCRRLGVPMPERAAMAEENAQWPEPEEGGYGAVHNVAATEDDCGFEYRMLLPKAKADQAREMAEAAGMTLEEFIQADLEGQFTRDELRDLDLPEVKKPLKLVVEDTDTAARLLRIADYKGESVLKMLDDEIESHIECFEDDWMFHPTTGKIIGDRVHWSLRNHSISQITERPLSEQRAANGKGEA